MEYLLINWNNSIVNNDVSINDRGDRLCGGSMDILGDRFLMRLGAIADWCCWFVEGRSLVS